MKSCFKIVISVREWHGFVCACDLHVHGLNSVGVGGGGGLVLQGENPGGNLRGPSN